MAVRSARLPPIGKKARFNPVKTLLLVFIPGEGTELYRGVGVVVLSGLLFATLVTLTFLPALLVTVLSLLRRRVA